MIVAGFGCRAGASAAALQAALDAALVTVRARCPGLPGPDVLAAALDRLAMLEPLADALGARLVGVDEVALRGQHTPTRSLRILAVRGCGSVAEAAALATAGPLSRLLVARHISPDRSATCALAQGSQT